MIGTLIPLALILWTCLIIWRACDGFEIASEYLGRHLSDGVRGGTINAIGSSIPEFLTTLIALLVLADEEGFAIGLGTTAGSALFNGMIIPAVCILSVVGVFGVAGGLSGISHVRVSRKVLLRDGLWLLLCEGALILVIAGDELWWFQGALLISLYVAYLTYMLQTMRSQAGSKPSDQDEDDVHSAASVRGLSWMAGLFFWISGGPVMDLPRWFVGAHQRRQMEEERWNAWPLLLASLAVLSAACYLLVLACEWLGTGPTNLAHPSYQFFGMTMTGLGMPSLFVAVIFASMATSVPDTVMSIRDARDGDYDDAVANALGSNVFDICFALGVPLLMYTVVHGPIELHPTVAMESAQLRVLLFFLTCAGLACFCFGRVEKDPAGLSSTVALGRVNACVLIALYGSFVLYIVGLVNSTSWAMSISDGLRWMVQLLMN